jgi:hypothetical protein
LAEERYLLYFTNFLLVKLINWKYIYSEHIDVFSAGIEFLMVNGTFVLMNGKTITGVMPGQPVLGSLKK